MSKILIISPHTDDAEIGCGGTISRLLREGNDVKVIALSAAQPEKERKFHIEFARPEGVFNDIFREFGHSMMSLGVTDYSNYLFQVRQFRERARAILDKLIDIRDGFQPDIVFCPASTDFHQDHRVIFEETLRTFKNTTILGFIYPWNNLEMHTDVFYKLNDKDIENKIKALKEYKSQSGRPYFQKDFIKAWARTNGMQVGTKYAESFEAIRIVK